MSDKKKIYVQSGLPKNNPLYENKPNFWNAKDKAKEMAKEVSEKVKGIIPKQVNKKTWIY